jgi:release factor glutamine methyltransferase
MSEPQPWTVKRLLEWTGPFFTRKGIEPARLSAEQLLAHVLSIPRIKLYTDYERVLEGAQLERFRELVKRAGEDEPIAYLIGSVPFFGMHFNVTRDVLIPRPDTETIVEHVLQIARNRVGLEAPRVLDLCTGSGCIAAAIAKNLKSSSVVATDKSERACAIATANTARLGLTSQVTVLQGDLFAAIDGTVHAQPFHFVVSNPPYIARGKIETLDRSVRDYEPIAALDGGEDGLDFHRRILAEASDRLLPGGYVLLEIAFDQGEAAKAIAQQSPKLTDLKVFRDQNGNDRVLIARRDS